MLGVHVMGDVVSVREESGPVIYDGKLMKEYSFLEWGLP